MMLALGALWIPLGIIMALTEETDLVIRFGEPYIKYRSKTGMFFPKSRYLSRLTTDVANSISRLFKSDAEK
jgi:hypothetical protein